MKSDQLLERLGGAVRRALEEPGQEEARRDHFLENLLQSSVDAFIATDLQGRITLFSREAERITGWRAEEVIGRPIADFYVGGKQEARRVMRLLRQHGRLSPYETKLKVRGGRVAILSLSISLVRDERGRVIGTLGVGRDVTELRRLERQMQLSDRLATVGQLAAGIAHELGTPLSVIQGTAEYLARDLDPDDPRRADLQLIISQAQRMASLVRQLLDFCRPKPPQVGAVCLPELVQRVFRLVGPQARKAKVELRSEVPPELPPLLADPEQMEQVLLNLSLNALQAMSGGGVLTVRARPGEGFLELEVIDTGCGIPPEHLDRIFDPFFTTKEVGRGTGLGLTVTQRIVAAHGGTIEVESEPGQGTTFRLRFPYDGAANPGG